MLKARFTAKKICYVLGVEQGSEDGEVLKVRAGRMLASPAGSGKPVGPAA